VALGVSLDGFSQTINQMWRDLARTAAIVVLAASAAGYLLVRRSLQPLRQVESTAAAIAAGDLTRRVPLAPAGTEVGALTDSLNGMLTQIEGAFSARTASERRMRQFVSDASHELRTPLAAIRGYGELYRIGAIDNPEELAGAMRRIEDEAARMGLLVGDLLQLTRLDEGRPGRREAVDLRVLAADAAADLKALDPSRTIRVVDLESGLREAETATDQARGGPPSQADNVTVVADSRQLRQVLANLVGNASRHTPAGSPVEIAVGIEPATPGQPRPAGVIEVRDHGPGIPPDLAAKVFERFFRLDASRSRDSGGTGLGLAIVASVVGGLGGKVWVLPTSGGGATFRVEIPSAHSAGEVCE
jgi:two-component system OmpR family sensor kinase